MYWVCIKANIHGEYRRSEVGDISATRADLMEAVQSFACVLIGFGDYTDLLWWK